MCRREQATEGSACGYVQEPANQKRLLLLSEHLSENVLLTLPHSQLVLSMPKALRIYFKNDRNLFAGISKIIFSIINDYYNEASQTPLKTGAIISYQSFGDLVRSNPHYHCIILEGGIDDEGCFHNLSIKDT